jgi:photoactive yellow protein
MMVSLATPEEPGLEPVFNPLAVEGLTDEELDRLPFGVIALSGAGLVLRYNLAEARFARLDRRQVIGQPFYVRIAPCTATAGFQGRVDRFLRDEAAKVTSFDYVFDFKFGAQQVHIEAVRGEQNAAVYLLVNRVATLPLRPPEVALAPAPLQAELAQGEAQAGVVRDAQGQRQVQVGPTFFASLRTAWDRMAPRGWALFCGEWGLQWGRLLVVDLEAEASVKHDRSLRDLPMQRMVDMLAGHLRDAGLGVLTADFSAAKQGAIVLRVERSALAEAVGASDVPRCQLLGGALRGVFNHLSRRLLAVREVSCAAQGHPHCTFALVSQPRLKALDEALAQLGNDLPAAIARLQSQPHA